MTSLETQRNLAEPTIERQNTPSGELPQRTKKTLQGVRETVNLLHGLKPETIPNRERAEFATVQNRLARNVRALAFLLCGIGASVGTYKTMDALATEIAQSVRGAVRALAPSAPSLDEGSQPGTLESADPQISQPSEEVAAETLPITNTGEVIIGDIPSFVTDGAQYMADQAAAAERDRRRQQSIETGETLGEMLATTLWQDPTFRALNSADAIERYIQAKVAEQCTDTEEDCSVYHVRTKVAEGLQARIREMAQSRSASAEQLTQVARGVRMVSEVTSTYESFGELDIALRSGRADLVSSFLHSPRASGSSDNSAYLQDYLTPERVQEFSGVYGRLPTEDRTHFEEALRQRIARLEQRGATQDAAQAQRIADQLRIPLETPEDSEDEESSDRV